jgi:hypothetical protein
VLWLPVQVEVVARRRRRRRRARRAKPVDLLCLRCYAGPGKPCQMWDGYGYRPLPYPHYERTLAASTPTAHSK